MRLPRLLSHNNGFTLTELMVVIGLIVIMSSVGYSGFSSIQKRQTVRSAAYELAGYLKEARMKAIEKSSSYIIDITIPPPPLPPSQYTIYMDANGNNTLEIGTDIVVQQVNLANVDPNITIGIAGANPWRYDPKGMARTLAGGLAMRTITFTNTDGFSVNLVISSLGRVTVNESSQIF